MMLGTAAFSHRPWISGVSFDPIEDLLHSATATIMGFCFAAGVILVGWARSKPSFLVRTLDGCTLLASIAVPLVMSGSTGYTGLLQRSMFVVAYLWYGGETLRSAR